MTEKFITSYKIDPKIYLPAEKVPSKNDTSHIPIYGSYPPPPPPGVCRLLCNALIQPHFDYACTAWYPNPNKHFVKKIQICQNKCIRFCLKLNNRDYVGVKEFREINWLPTKERFEQCVCANIFKFFKNTSPTYTSELYQPSVTDTTQEGQIADYNYHTEILVMVIKLFLS